MRTIGDFRLLAAAGGLLGTLILGCSGSTSSPKPDALAAGGTGGGQVGSTAGNSALAGSVGGRTASAGSGAGSTASPTDGGPGGAMDAVGDGSRDGTLDVPRGSNDAGADSSLDVARNPDLIGDAARDRIPGIDTRDSAALPKDTAPDGSSPCGACLSGLTCGGGGVANQCGVTIAPRHGKDCSIAGWCVEADRPILSAIHARTPDDIWAVGRAGQIAHFDGSVWTITSGVIQSRDFVANSSGSGLDRSFNGSEFTGVWASGPSDIWVIASVPDPTNTTSLTYLSLLLRGDGIHWNVVLMSTDSTFSYRGIWGTGPDDVWLAQQKSRQGNSTSVVPSVIHWDGAAWTTLVPPDTYNNMSAGCGEQLHAIAGLSANDIYLACDRYLWRFDGTTWTGFPQRAQAVWGTSASSLWVTYFESLFHKVGDTWVQMTTPESCGTGVWGVSDSSLWFGGCYYDGSKWTQLYPAMQIVRGPTATGALGLTKDGNLVNLTPTSAVSSSSPAMYSYDIAGSDPNDVWIVGSNVDTTNTKARALHWDGSSFKVIDQTSPDGFTTIAVLPGNDVWAGDSKGLWRWSGSSFVASSGAPKGARQQMWSPSKDAIWAVTGSDAAIWYFDGTAWQKLPHGLNATTVKLAAVWGSSPTDVWVAGSAGMTEHWNGTAWTAYDAGVDDLIRVWGTSPTEVFVAAKNGNVYAWDGTRWALSSTVPLAKSSLVDYRACAANDIWASVVTQYGNLLVPELAHFDGSAWHTYTPGELELPNGTARVFCAAPGDVWMVHQGADIRRLRAP